VSYLEILLIAIGLSMDAFAVSICRGLSSGDNRLENAVTSGCYFGGFQALMPVLGHMPGIRFQTIVQRVDHWVALLLLGGIGLKMIRESGLGQDNSAGMLKLAIATSINALPEVSSLLS